jgi:hypothetical protein
MNRALAFLFALSFTFAAHAGPPTPEAPPNSAGELETICGANGTQSARQSTGGNVMVDPRIGG